MRLRATVPDDRSRPVPLMYIGLGHRLIAALLPGVTALPRESHRQVVVDMQSVQKSLGSRFTGRVLLVGFVPPIVANIPVIVGFSARAFLSPWFWCFFVVWMILTIPLSACLMWHLLSIELRSSVAKAILRQRCCPSCGYFLAGLTPNPDDRTTCPECAAAWRLP